MAAFDALPPSFRRRVLDTIRRHHAALAGDVWLDEVRRLSADSQRLVAASDLNDAPAQTRCFAQQVAEFDAPSTHLLDYLIRSVERMSPAGWQDESTGRIYRRIRETTHPKADRTEAPGMDPRELPRGTDVAPMRLKHVGDEFGWTSIENESGSPLATVSTTNRILVLESPTRPRDGYWESGSPPQWASDWGRDEIGPWVEFQVVSPTDDAGSAATASTSANLSQRLRWIPPGTFHMGSPESELERLGDEGPQHEVTITQGFWMFDTAVTQELWEAVMGNNPSHFRGKHRPVERVSWEDCQAFLQQLKTQSVGAPLDFPTESHWEYACRAGTTTPFSFGDNISPEQVNYDGNFPYGGGEKGLYRQETVDVGSLPANSWGLHEMHGNVWEWCRDGRRVYTAEPAIDPEGPSEPGVARVIRGGCWNFIAGFARSASRSADAPGRRDSDLGFRCALVQGEAEPETAASTGRQAERRPGETHRGEATRIVVRLDENPSCRIPTAQRLHILTDLDELELDQFTKPSWASAIGRDGQGMWAEFTVDSPESSETVTQRMRWIPPGRFLMGSSDPEDSRWFDAKPQHEVVITHGFWLFDTPITQALWAAVMHNNPSKFTGASRPVERVSWHDCQTFMERLEQNTLGTELVLPTEAEWEYACRAGTQTAYFFGDQITPRDARFRSDKEDDERGTVDVGSYAANPFGLYDMHGNVWEWCFDGLRQYNTATAVDPLGADDEGVVRVFRGGCWFNFARSARSACRDALDLGYRVSDLGFRCALVQARARKGPSERSERSGRSTEETPDRSD